jgi:hypothetical protein
MVDILPAIDMGIDRWVRAFPAMRPQWHGVGWARDSNGND